jgi:two-component system, NarL family, invasion response regulator UvrY
MEAKKSIVLVDDHVVVRSGLKELIEKLGPYKVTGEYSDGLTFLGALPLKHTPDLVILDLGLPGMTGDKVVEQMNARKIGIPVLILTLNQEEDVIVGLFRNGVRGYLQKSCSAAVMKSALEEIFSTGYYHNEFLTLSLRNPAAGTKSGTEKVLEQLTAREKEFLRLVCHEKEYTYEQIADLMSVQHRTVDGYRESLFDKFGIKSKTGLVLFVLKHKLFDHLGATPQASSS